MMAASSGARVERLLPQNVEAERSILGAVLLQQECMISIVDRLSPDDFSRSAHRDIWGTMLAMYVDGVWIDQVTLVDALAHSGTLAKVGGVTYLGGLTEGLPRGMNVEHYTNIVIDAALRRRLISSSDRVQNAAYGQKAPEAIANAERAIMELAASVAPRGGAQPLSDLVTEAADVLEGLYKQKQAISGLATGLRELDEMTTGWHRGDLVIVGARPSAGKTSLMLGGAAHAGVAGARGVLFSLEMTALQLAIRMICSEGRVDLKRLRSGYLSHDEISRISHAITSLSATHVWIDDASALSATEVRARAQRLSKRLGGLDLVGIDYLQLITTARAENRHLGLASVTAAMKAMAKDLKVPGVLLAQLGRGVERRGDKRPLLSDLRDGGATEADADAVLFIVPSDPSDQNADRGVAELVLRKQRNGPVGELKVAFIREYARFESLAWSPPDSGYGPPSGRDRQAGL